MLEYHTKHVPELHIHICNKVQIQEGATVSNTFEGLQFISVLFKAAVVSQDTVFQDIALHKHYHLSHL